MAEERHIYVEPTYTGRNGVKTCWEGFKKSVRPADTQRRYNAKCKFCGLEFLGIGDKLRAHKLKCDRMPSHIRQVNDVPFTIRKQQLSSVYIKGEPLASQPSTSSATVTSPRAKIIKRSLPSTGPKRTVKIRSVEAPITSNPNPTDPHQTNKLLLKMLLKYYVPFQLMESEEFIDFVQSLNPDYTVTDLKTFSNGVMSSFFDEVKEHVACEVGLAERIGIAAESWTSTANEAYITLTAHFAQTFDSSVKVVALECRKFPEPHTPENVGDRIEEICVDWSIWDKVYSITTDDAFNMSVSVGANGNKVHIPCVANSLNLIIRRALHELSDFRQQLKSIVEFFVGNVEATRTLFSYQEWNNEPTDELVVESPDQWHTTYLMFKSFHACSQSIQQCLSEHFSTQPIPNITEEDMSVLSEIIEMLSIFVEITSSQSQWTISDVIVMGDEIRTVYERLLDSSPSSSDLVYNMCIAIREEWLERFGPLGQEEHFAFATLLDPRYKKFGFKNTSHVEEFVKRLKEECAEILVKSEDAVEATPQAKTTGWRKSFHERVQKVSGSPQSSNETAKAILEVDCYLAEPVTAFDPFAWWDKNKLAYPRLYKLMLQYLPLPSTAVPADRLFSQTGQIISQMRTRLTGEKVPEMVFLNANSEYF